VQNYHDGSIKVARQTQHFIRTMSTPADLLQLPFFAINWRPTCLYVAQWVTKWCSVLFQHVWLHIIQIQIFWESRMHFTCVFQSHFSTSLAQPCRMVYTILSFACPINNQRRTFKHLLAYTFGFKSCSILAFLCIWMLSFLLNQIWIGIHDILLNFFAILDSYWGV